MSPDLPDDIESALVRILDDPSTDRETRLAELSRARPDLATPIRQFADDFLRTQQPVQPLCYGRYEVVRELGRGAMGVVYEARDPGSNVPVAIKVIQRDARLAATALDRFRREARLTAAVHHPRSVMVLGADLEGTEPYIVMERMPGPTLQDELSERGPLPINDAIRRILDVVDGLQAAHALGVVHRDVKPSNCFLSQDGRVKVGDYGLSRLVVDDAMLTVPGGFVGTPIFASPEQVLGEPVDGRTDVYSVCATLYFLLTGRPPIAAPDPNAAIARIPGTPPEPIEALRPDVGASLQRIIHRGLEKSRARRWQRMDQLREALAQELPAQPRFEIVGRRFVATVTDAAIYAFFLDRLVMQLTGYDSLTEPPLAYNIAGYAILVAYLTLQEGLWDKTIGKHLARLVVHRAHTTNGPGLLRSLGRAVIFVTPAWALLLLLGSTNPLPALFGNNLAILVYVQFGLLFLPAAALAATMRRGNGYRAIHDLLTGTVVRSEADQNLDAPAFDFAERIAAATPPPRMSWDLAGSGSGASEPGSYLARDDELDRNLVVGVGERTPPDVPLDAPDRPARLRWIAAGSSGTTTWNAYALPLAAPLTQVLDRPAGWPIARPILAHLSAEMAARQRDGTLATELSLSMVWLRFDGVPILLDRPLRNVAAAPGPVHTGESRADRLLREVSLVVGGDPTTHTQPPETPVHANSILRLIGHHATQDSALATVSERFQATASLPTGLTRKALSVQVAARGIGLLFWCLPIHLKLPSCEYGQQLVILAYARQLEPAHVSDLIKTIGSAGVDASEVERSVQALLAELRQLQAEWNTGLHKALSGLMVRVSEQDILDVSAVGSWVTVPDPRAGLMDLSERIRVASFGNGLLLSLAVGLLWTLLFGTGLSHRISRTQLVTRDGTRAGFFRCLVRNLLLAAPLAGPWAAAAWIVGPSMASLQLAHYLWTAGLLAVVVFAFIGFVCRRGPHDWLMGTWLVSK